MTSWSEIAKRQDIRYFLVSFVDLFGAMRAKLVPPAPWMPSPKPAPASRALPPGST